MEIIKNADYIIDLGPEGGDKGGEVVACGTPEEVAVCPASITGKYLAEKLESNADHVIWLEKNSFCRSSSRGKAAGQFYVPS